MSMTFFTPAWRRREKSSSETSHTTFATCGRLAAYRIASKKQGKEKIRWHVIDGSSTASA
jgi:hypothetical protein